MKTFFLSLLFGWSLSLFAQSGNGVSVKARVFLEGALMNNGNALSSTGTPLMRDNLRLSPYNNQGYIPLNDPYKYPHPNFDITSRFTHVPANQATSMHQITNPAILQVSGDNAIVDWVFMELRSAQNSSQVIATRSCLLQRDGDITDLDGTSNVFFPGVTGSQFYIAIRHRSHLGVMSLLWDISLPIDFTVPTTPTFDFGMVSPQLNYTGTAQNKLVAIGYRAMWAGDFNADGRIKFNGVNDDLSPLMMEVLFHADNTQYNSSFDNAIGYFNSDFNMNSKAKFDNPFDDKNFLFAQCLFYENNAYLLINYDFFKEQLP